MGPEEAKEQFLRACKRFIDIENIKDKEKLFNRLDHDKSGMISLQNIEKLYKDLIIIILILVLIDY